MNSNSKYTRKNTRRTVITLFLSWEGFFLFLTDYSMFIERIPIVYLVVLSISYLFIHRAYSYIILGFMGTSTIEPNYTDLLITILFLVNWILMYYTLFILPLDLLLLYFSNWSGFFIIKELYWSICMFKVIITLLIIYIITYR